MERDVRPEPSKRSRVNIRADLHSIDDEDSLTPSTGTYP